jgi:hypothetical protein
MAITEDRAAEIGIEVNEAIPAIIEFVGLPTEDKALVIKKTLDGLIGTDETAIIDTIPGLTPAITEGVTDGLLDVLAGALAKKFFPAGE